MTIKIPRYLLVGAGLFAQNSYIPHLQQLDEKGRAKLMAIVEVYGNEHLRPLYSDLEFLFVPPFEKTMPSSVHIELDLMIHRLRIDCVIISTEPLAHKAYGLWALKKGLNVIMDKPITTRKQACTSISAASGIAEDFEELQNAYDELQTRKQTCFLIQCHRRYHPGFDFVTDKIREIQALTGCPITSMSSSHCDGQWRMPKEIVEQDYHTFKTGYGKISHSGYHLLDICSCFMKASWGPDMTGPKVPDRLEVISSFTTAGGFYTALNDDDYMRIFGHEYSKSHSYTNDELTKLMDGMGEYDCAILMTAYRGVHPICLVQLNLLHAGFSRRSSLEMGHDLYRGVGRVKHESHDIKCGPFQTLVADCRKSEDRPKLGIPSKSTIGSENHFDVHVFRNVDALKVSEAPCQSYSMNDILGSSSNITEELSANVKRGILEESIDFMNGRIRMNDLRSNLPDHDIPAHIMSATYHSHVRRGLGLSPVVTIQLKNKGTESLTASIQD